MRQSWLAELEANHRDHEALVQSVVAALRTPADPSAARRLAARLHTGIDLHLAYAQEVLGPWAARLLPDGELVRARLEHDHGVLHAAVTAARYALHCRAIERALRQFEALAEGLRTYRAREQAMALQLRRARDDRRALAG